MNLPRSLFHLISSNVRPVALNRIHRSLVHLDATLFGYDKPNGANKFIRHNKTIYPPQALDEEPRHAYVCHVKKNFYYSPKKMWHIAAFVRGMTVDEAVRQLSFLEKKGSDFAKEAILEAQELAVKEHNVEFKSNLWISESFVNKGVVFKGVRRHARARFGEVEYKHCHYYITLEEGKPPADYYGNKVTPEQQLEKYMEQMRKRKISNSL